MKFTLSNALTIEDPTQEMLIWCKKNLTIPNPEYAKKLRMNFWLGNTPQVLTLYEQQQNRLILPFGTLKMIPSYLRGNASFQSNFTPHCSVGFEGNDIPLYDYQKSAVEALIGARFGILQSPAGSGKTQIGIALTKQYNKPTLWLTHTIDLLNQSKARAEQYIDNSLIGTITEGKVNIGKGITFATIQTMCKLDLAQYKNMWDVIIVDECHRVAGTPTAMTQFYKVLNSLTARHKYGLSATVHRADGMIIATYALLGQVAHIIPEDAVGDKIMKVGILPVGTGTEISRGCLNTDGTLNYARLITYLTENENRNATIVNRISLSEGNSCLILSDRLEHLSTLMNRLPEHMQKDAVMVSGKMTSKKGKAERERALDDMRDGKKKYLFATYSLAKEGLDVPCLERLFLTTPQKDYAVITQSIGRIARAYPDKVDPIAIDFVDNIGYLVRAYKKRCTTYRKNGCYFVDE